MNHAYTSLKEPSRPISCLKNLSANLPVVRNDMPGREIKKNDRLPKYNGLVNENKHLRYDIWVRQFFHIYFFGSRVKNDRKH